MHDVVKECVDTGPVVLLLLLLMHFVVVVAVGAAAVAEFLLVAQTCLSAFPQSFVHAAQSGGKEDRESDEDELGGVGVLDVDVLGSVGVGIRAVEHDLELVVS